MLNLLYTSLALSTQDVEEVAKGVDNVDLEK